MVLLALASGTGQRSCWVAYHRFDTKLTPKQPKVGLPSTLIDSGALIFDVQRIYDVVGIGDLDFILT